MKFFIVIFGSLFIVGCSSPLPEYNYRATVLEPDVANAALATDFSAALTKECELQIVDQSMSTGNKRADETFSVDLRPKTGEKIYVTVMTNSPAKMLFFAIGGNIELPKAKEVALCAETLYSKKYPGSKLTLFARYGGLFGP